MPRGLTVRPFGANLNGRRRRHQARYRLMWKGPGAWDQASREPAHSRGVAERAQQSKASPPAAFQPKSKTPLEAGPRLIVIWYNSDSGGSGGIGGRPTHQLTISRAAAGKGSSIKFSSTRRPEHRERQCA